VTGHDQIDGLIVIAVASAISLFLVVRFFRWSAAREREAAEMFEQARRAPAVDPGPPIELDPNHRSPEYPHVRRFGGGL
jgi:hypothetical protein